MGDPRNPARRFEKWDMERVDALRSEVTALAVAGLVGEVRGITVSGGWAWHFMSPPHEEFKLLHDHKDIDLFVKPEEYPWLAKVLQEREYHRVWTKYDRVSQGEFYRWELFKSGAVRPIKVILDVFLKEVPTVTANGVPVVEPTFLLGMYRAKKHTTDDCVAVQVARVLLADGISPVGRAELIAMPPR